MAPQEDAVKMEDDKYTDLIVKLIADIRNGKLEESEQAALATVSLLEQIINDSSDVTTYELSRVLRCVGGRLSRAVPGRPELGNMVRRVLRALAAEHRALHHNPGVEGVSLQRLVLGAPRRGTLGAAAASLAEPLREHIAELRLELESGASCIGAALSTHVRADECVLTLGSSALVARCLLRAARGCRLVAAGSGREFHSMAAKLSASGVAVTVIDPSAVFAVMSRVNKVVLAATAVGCGGAAAAGGGARSLVAAAKHFSVPVLVLSPFHLLTPLHAAELAAAAAADTHTHTQHVCGAPVVSCPASDALPPELVTLYITNLGASSPTYVYRLLSELYEPSDYSLL